MLEQGRKSDPILALFFVSGFAGLVYEAIWTHYLKLFLGHAAYAQTVVLVVFIGGLALGAWICARVAKRVRNPLRMYAYVEGAIGLLSLVFHPLFLAATDWGYASLLPAACDQATTFCLPQWLLSALLLLPQSILLGATFPLVSSAVLRIDTSQPGHDVAALYFLNSLGAVLGVLAAAFVLIPWVGLPGTLTTIAALNLLLGLAAFLLSHEAPAPLAIASMPANPVEAPQPDDRLVHILLATALVTGLSSFIYEIAWIRMLSLVLGASTHSFEVMLASFILGLALGGAWVRSRVDRADTIRLLARVQLAMGAAAALTLPVYSASFDFMAWMLTAVGRSEGGFVIYSLATTAIALAVMLPATFCAGMTLPLITYRLLRSPSGESSLGLVYAVNTLGSIIGVVIAVHLLLETLGVRGALLVGAAIDVALGVGLLLLLRPKGVPLRLPAEVVAAVAVLAAIGLAFHVDPRKAASGVFRTGLARLPSTDALVFHRDGKTATVDVVRQDKSFITVRTNGKPDASISLSAFPLQDEYTQALLGILPMGYRPDAKTAAVIGFGSGMTSAVMLASPTLRRLDTIEIEPAMVQASQSFRPHTDAAHVDPRSRIVIDDAKSYFARGRERYDIIVSEPSNPWVSGVSSLFTHEFYARLAVYLTEGGVLTQWLHGYEMDAQTLASILQAVSKTFPEYALYTSNAGDFLLVARKGAPLGAFDERVLALPGLQQTLTRLKLTDARILDRWLIASSEGLHPFFASYEVPANSDFFPIVDQRAGKTRFTQVRVLELGELYSSSIPLLELLGGARPPAHEPVGDLVLNPNDAATSEAWRLERRLSGAAAPDGQPILDPRHLAAELVRLWGSCASSLTFDQLLPSILSVGDLVNTRLHPTAATQVWRSIAASPCGRRLAPREREWIDLLEAIARRDSGAMRGIALKVLSGDEQVVGPPTELAFVAAVAGSICGGDRQGARRLLDQQTTRWVRQGALQAELRLLRALALAPDSTPMSSPACRRPPA